METKNSLQWKVQLDRNLIEWMINDEWYLLSTSITKKGKTIILSVDYDDPNLIERITKMCGDLSNDTPLLLQFHFKLNTYASQYYILLNYSNIKITYRDGIVQLLSISISEDDAAYLQNMVIEKFSFILKEL